MDWINDLLNQNYDWMMEASLALIVTLMVMFGWKLFRNRLLAITGKTNNQWDDIVIESLSAPLNWAILVIGLSWIGDITARHFVYETANVPIARQVAMIVLIAWLGWRFVVRVEDRQLNMGKDPTTVQVIGKIAKILVVILMVMPMLQILGISISGMLAFGGVGGLVVGMAAKDLLANFFGSIIIYLDRPFKIGDWIRSPDRNIEGVVEKIGFRVTLIRTFDKRPLYVPNSVFTSISVENPSRMRNRRIKETIGVRYDDAKQLPKIINEVKSMLQNHSEIDTSQTLIVNFNSFGASSLDFFIYTFTKTTNWVEFHRIKQDVMLKILEIIHDNGADCAFPTQTLHIQQDAIQEEPSA